MTFQDVGNWNISSICARDTRRRPCPTQLRMFGACTLLRHLVPTRCAAQSVCQLSLSVSRSAAVVEVSQQLLFGNIEIS